MLHNTSTIAHQMFRSKYKKNNEAPQNVHHISFHERSLITINFVGVMSITDTLTNY